MDTSARVATARFRALGKLLTDEAFRERFFAEPVEACWEAGLTLSSIELEALAGVSREDLARFGDNLDQRISRPSLGAWREQAQEGV